MLPPTRFAARILAVVCLLTVAGPWGHAARADGPRIVASIKPVYSLVVGVTEGITVPTLLIKGTASPHSHALSPSDAAALESADVVFWIGESFENFLTRPLATLTEGNTTIVALDRLPGLTLYDRRTGGLWAGAGRDDHGEEGNRDGHIWLNPKNAAIMVGQIANTLSELDPGNAEAYRSNARRLTGRLSSLDAEIEQTLAPVIASPFIVFHDAFQYFERRYGLASVGSITANPDQPPGARRLQQMREAIIDQGVVCVFREPNFEPALVQSMADETSARVGVLDPEGALLPESPDLYFDLLRGIAMSLKECLSAGS